MIRIIVTTEDMTALLARIECRCQTELDLGRFDAELLYPEAVHAIVGDELAHMIARLS